MGSAVGEVACVAAAAARLREQLAASQRTSEQMTAILGSFDDRLSTLETAMRPTQIRTHSFRKAYENIELTLKQAEEVLAQFDVSRQVEPRVKEGPRRDLEGYLGAVDRLQAAVAFFARHRQFRAAEAAGQHARDLLREALLRLEEDFRNLLAQHSKSADPERLAEALPDSGGAGPGEEEDAAGSEFAPKEKAPPVSLPQMLPPAVITRLHAIADRLVTGGSTQCAVAYREIRDKTLEQSLRRLGVERLKTEDIFRMQWEDLEGRISGWIKHLRIAILVLFVSEKQLCDAVLAGLDPLRERTFADIADGGAALLFSFGQAIARSKKSPEKLFVLLDMYETLRDLLPHVDNVFSGKACAPTREAARALLQRLAQTARETFAEFEEAVEKDGSKQPVEDGAVHPLTSYVINYVKFLFEYHTTLQELMGESDKISEKGSADGQPRLAVATARIMQVLQSNLEGKAKLYKDPALSQVFLMNNVHYMVRSIKKSEAKDMLGDEWIQRHRRIVQQHASTYQRTSWSKVTQALNTQGLSGEGSATRTAVKERFKQFNASIEEVHARQCMWTIPDAELRSAVQLQVAEVLVPAYRSFVTRFSGLLEQSNAFGKQPNPQKYLKYQPDDLEAMLGELFEGKVRT